MPDYASILRRSISALPDPNSEMREAVYERARAALARQLTAVDPPLSSREIESQHQELEDAVARLEAEYAPQEAARPAYEPPPQDDFLFTSPPAPSAPRPSAQQPVRGVEDMAADFEADDEDDDFDDDEDEDRASRIPALVGLVVVVLVVVGIVGYAFSQRDTMLAFFGFGPEVEDTGQRVVPQETAATDETEKQSDRLINGTEAPTSEPEPSDTVTIAPSPNVEETIETPAPSMTTALSAEGEQAVGEPDEEAGPSLVGQRAIYYYQGAEGQAGEAHEGIVTWSNITKDGNPAIRAMLSISERDVEASVTIYKNYDASLPASHLVEIEFRGALSESPIQRVPALVLKQTEQGRGQPLAGAAVPVTNELFWIALSDDDEQTARNVQLLQEGSWFDVPILYSDQTRALITFEKGIPGDRVFETVMASWVP